jgi:hypothetical protein
MTEQEFQRLMIIYGADISRWPAGRQAAAEKWKGAHPEARSALRRTEAMDRLLKDAAPRIDPMRVDRVLDAVLGETARITQPRRLFPMTLPRLAWPQWPWAPRGALYLGLFILGCAANLAVRLLTTDTPLDLWFSGNLSLPLGG